MPNDVPTSELPRGGAAGVVLLVVFLALACWFVAGPDLSAFPRHDSFDVMATSLSTGPLRQMQDDPPSIFVGGFDRHCMECHRFFQPDRETNRQLVQHTHIVLDHGLNDLCLNCHDRVDANRLALRGKQTVPFTRSEQLCAKCHGPTYRDWQRGMHGKTLGYWDSSRGTSRRLTCVECHDPHAPAFPSLRPLPGPSTLRMVLVPPSEGEHDSPRDHADPLRKWQYHSPEPHPPLEKLPLVDPPGTKRKSEVGERKSENGKRQ